MSLPDDSATQLVLELIDGFNQMDIERILACFADAAVYHNIPMEAVTGQDNIRAALQPFLAGSTAVQWDLISIAEDAQGRVLTERVDKFEIGGKWISIAVMGVFEVVDGKIAAWRDYFDLAQFQSQMAPA